MGTDITWVVLAGGKGTRSENPNFPKLLQRIGDSDVLGLLLSSLPQDETLDLVFVLKHGANEVEASLQARRHLYPSVGIRVIYDEGVGPVAALKQIQSIQIRANVGVILGDTAMNAPLALYRDSYLERGASGPAIAIRQSDHLSDSTVVSIDWQGNPVRFFDKGETLDASSGMLWGMTGLVFLPSKQIEKLDSSCKDVATALLESSPLGNITFFPISHFFRDSGTPERIRLIRDHFQRIGSGQNPSVSSLRKALFVDRDGTLLPDMPNGRTHVLDSELNLAVVELIRNANRENTPVFLCTNQPAIAKGFVSVSQTYMVHNELQRLLMARGAKFDDFYVCPHHPERGHRGEVAELKLTCACRKPSTGMIERAAKAHGISLTPDTILLGDTDADRLAARKAGISFKDVSTLKSSRD